MTKKYNVASSMMIPKVVEPLSPGILRPDRVAKNNTVKNARKSGVRALSRVSPILFGFEVPMIPTHHTRGRCLCTRSLAFDAGQKYRCEMRPRESVGPFGLHKF